MKSIPVFLSATSLLLLAGILRSGAVTLSLPASADATLYQSATGATANGAGENVFAGVTALGSIRRALIRFDIAGSVPAGATITSVQLILFMNQGRLGPASLHQALASWDEGPTNAAGAEGQGALAETGSATWLHRRGSGQVWGTAGGDFLATASATVDIGNTGYVSWTGPGLLADIQEWQAQPELNFGWAILGAEYQSQTANRFSSRTSPTLANRPSLVLEYQLIPEPAGIASLAAVGLFLTCVRRRPAHGVGW